MRKTNSPIVVGCWSDAESELLSNCSNTLRFVLTIHLQTDKLPNGAYMPFVDHGLDEFGWSNGGSIKWIVTGGQVEAQFPSQTDADSGLAVNYAEMLSPVFAPIPRYHSTRSSRLYHSCKVSRAIEQRRTCQAGRAR
jgi:hypothetical protein